MEKPKDLLCLEGISCLAFNKDFTGMELNIKLSLFNFPIQRVFYQKRITTFTFTI